MITYGDYTRALAERMGTPSHPQSWRHTNGQIMKRALCDVRDKIPGGYALKIPAWATDRTVAVQNRDVPDDARVAFLARGEASFWAWVSVDAESAGDFRLVPMTVDLGTYEEVDRSGDAGA